MRPRKKDRHLPKCVYHQHGAYWLVKRGKWERIGTSLRVALEEYAKRLETPKGTVPALVDEVLAIIKPNVSKSTYSNYRTASAKLKYAFQDIQVEDVTAATIWDFRDKWAATPNMTNRCLTLLRQVFDHAVRRQRIPANPALGVRRHDEKQRDRLVSKDEYRALYEKAGPRLQIIMDLCYLTGQRVVDVLTIRRADITEDGINFKQDKTEAKLLVRWTPELRAVVDRAKTLQGKVTALTLLHNRRGKAPDYSTVKLQWDTARSAAGILDVQMRDLRAMSITEADEQGKNPQKLAGHASPDMTRRYLRRKKVPKVDGPSF
jgi:integrase